MNHLAHVVKVTFLMPEELFGAGREIQHEGCNSLTSKTELVFSSERGVLVSIKHAAKGHILLFDSSV